METRSPWSTPSKSELAGGEGYILEAEDEANGIEAEDKEFLRLEAVVDDTLQELEDGEPTAGKQGRAKSTHLYSNNYSLETNYMRCCSGRSRNGKLHSRRHFFLRGIVDG
jgi:hypothetical protein